MAGNGATTPASLSLKGLRFGVPRTILQDDLAPQVADAFAGALSLLSEAGAIIEEFDFPALQREREGSKKANFSAVEAYALHRERLANRLDQFDPRVAKRLLLGASIMAADYVDLLHLRQSLIGSANATTARFDALLAPTVPIIAPTIAEMESSDEIFLGMNGLLLRNCAPFNVLDRPCWSLPCHRRGDAPTGLMVIGETMGDWRLQAIGLAIETLLVARR